MKTKDMKEIMDMLFTYLQYEYKGRCIDLDLTWFEDKISPDITRLEVIEAARLDDRFVVVNFTWYNGRYTHPGIMILTK